MRLREESGQLRFGLGGNFLVRSRRHWLDDDTLVLVVDALGRDPDVPRRTRRSKRIFLNAAVANVAECVHPTRTQVVFGPV